VRKTCAPAALATVAACACLSACGELKSPDLFIVHRSGAGAHAGLTLIVTEEGGVSCDGRQAGRLEDPQIIKARTIQEDLKEPASHHVSLAPRPGSVLSYYVRDEHGSVRFSDTSLHQPPVFRELALFVLQTAQQVCRLPE
jgi:hypothetical protein